jgi:hypothetical protein
MSGFMPGIHGFFSRTDFEVRTWMATTRPRPDLCEPIGSEKRLTFADTDVISTPPGTSGLSAFALESEK